MIWTTKPSGRGRDGRCSNSSRSGLLTKLEDCRKTTWKLLYARQTIWIMPVIRRRRNRSQQLKKLSNPPFITPTKTEQCFLTGQVERRIEIVRVIPCFEVR